MTLAVGVALLVVVAVAIVFAARLLRRPARNAVSPLLEAPVPELPELELPEPELLEPEPEAEPVITWTEALTVSALGESARLRLIDDLTLIAAPWTIALLHRAYGEESSAPMRARIEAALASSGERV
jgi:hypothetical protein